MSLGNALSASGVGAQDGVTMTPNELRRGYANGVLCAALVTPLRFVSVASVVAHGASVLVYTASGRSAQ